MKKGLPLIVLAAGLLLGAAPETPPEIPTETPLEERLIDDGSAVRRKAVQELRKLPVEGKELILESLTKSLTDEKTEIRSRAALAIFLLGPTAAPAVPALGEALADESTRVRGRAASALGNIGAPAAPAVPGLIKMTRDAVFGMRTTAITALGKIGPAAKDAVERLMEIASGENEALLRRAVIALGLIGTEAAEAAPLLADILKKGQPRTQVQAAKALARVRPDEDTVERLLGGLKDEVPPVRAASAKALGTLGATARSAVKTLKKIAAKDHSKKTQQAAKVALIQIEEE